MNVPLKEFRKLVYFMALRQKLCCLLYWIILQWFSSQLQRRQRKDDDAGESDVAGSDVTSGVSSRRCIH